MTAVPSARRRLRTSAPRPWRAEFTRWRGEVLLRAFLPLALLSALSIAAALPADLRSAPPEAIDALAPSLRASAVSGLLVLSAVLGGLGITIPVRTGVLARELLGAPAAVVYGARATTTTLSACVFAACGIAAAQIVFLVVSGRALVDPAAVLPILVVAVAAGMWGHLLGMLVRSPILVLFVVPATLMPVALLVDAAPVIADALPLRAMLAVAEPTASDLDPLAAGAATVLWLLVLAAAAVATTVRRDRI